MRRLAALLAVPLLAIGLAGPADAQVGKVVPDNIELDDFANTDANDFGDFTGRTILIEFFAYW
ncbi:hypothetical protein [Engelhardtia mirabilis]|uniref:Redoxin domain-containing protein n=1 Tax=Engelhardtia mirabilis TaxID=2528011 RepID=A0A518BIZ6_9BACT|nr:hypothetical protein Pla133_20370 [Planctomycetes bacterium Pla133]QDV01289.1 hypothetical protein Pla86_20380 [Planctomycetes bacterium Pla86]